MADLGIKPLWYVGIIAVVLLLLAWLLYNLGLGQGLGLGGKGPGPGGSGTATAPSKEPPPVTDQEQRVVVSGATATLNDQPITPDEVAQRAKAGQAFVIEDKGDAQARIMEEFLKVAKASEGKVRVKE